MAADENIPSTHNVVGVDTLQNLIVRLNQPESVAPALIYVMTWQDPRQTNVETFVRIETLPPELQMQIREHVRGAKINVDPK